MILLRVTGQGQQAGGKIEIIPRKKKSAVGVDRGPCRKKKGGNAWVVDSKAGRRQDAQTR